MKYYFGVYCFLKQPQYSEKMRFLLKLRKLCIQTATPNFQKKKVSDQQIRLNLIISWNYVFAASTIRAMNPRSLN
jgi:hypothetical protein